MPKPRKLSREPLQREQRPQRSLPKKLFIALAATLTLGASGCQVTYRTYDDGYDNNYRLEEAPDDSGYYKIYEDGSREFIPYGRLNPNYLFFRIFDPKIHDRDEDHHRRNDDNHPHYDNRDPIQNRPPPQNPQNPPPFMQRGNNPPPNRPPPQPGPQPRPQPRDESQRPPQRRTWDQKPGNF